MIDKKKLRELLRQGNSHIIINDRLDGTQTIISAHKSYESARRTILNGLTLPSTAELV